MDMAISAYLQAIDGGEAQPIGVAVTASVATLEPHKGDHRVHAAVISPEAILASDMILPKSAGRKARQRDGIVADNLGLELVLAASGVHPKAVTEAYRVATEGRCCRDATKDATRQFMARPLITKDGRRLQAPLEEVPVLFPGNFDPPHPGHFANAAAVKGNVTFQVSANPPHKAALSLQDMLKRVHQFRGRGDLLFSDDDRRYIDKARRFPGAEFILGTDAVRRMLDPQWSIEPEALLQEFMALNTRFRVAGRHNESWETIREELKVPHWAWHMFGALPRTEYADLSSTKLREASAPHP
jgi:hypothetical protein